MGVHLREIVNVGTAACVPDLIREPKICDTLDDLRLGAPEIGIVDPAISSENQRKQATETRENLRMGGSRGARADHLADRW